MIALCAAKSSRSRELAALGGKTNGSDCEHHHGDDDRGGNQ
jgi:hypothetical protein